MKKIILVLMLIVTLAMSAQTQERYVYQNAAVSLDGKVTKSSGVESVVYVNYRNEPVIKVYAPNGEVILYDCVSEILEGTTNNGSDYWYGTYERRDNGARVLIQLFKETSSGIRFMSFDGKTSIQFF